MLLCVFTVLYFSVLSETGMFDIMVNRLVGAANNLACELAEVDIIKQVKYSVVPCLAFNTIAALLCVILRIA